jgi:hypothetical protein
MGTHVLVELVRLHRHGETVPASDLIDPGRRHEIRYCVIR